MSGTNPLSGNVYLDTNIFIEAFEEKDEISRLLERLFRSASASSRLHLFTSQLTLAEALAKPYEEKRTDLVSLYEAALTDNSALTIIPIDASVLRGLASARSVRKMKLPDAIQATAAAYCRTFLTDDTGFRSDALLLVARPTASILTNLIGRA